MSVPNYGFQEKMWRKIKLTTATINVTTTDNEYLHFGTLGLYVER
jgi:hypothetical protein